VIRVNANWCRHVPIPSLAAPTPSRRRARRVLVARGEGVSRSARETSPCCKSPFDGRRSAPSRRSGLRLFDVRLAEASDACAFSSCAGEAGSSVASSWSFFTGLLKSTSSLSMMPETCEPTFRSRWRTRRRSRSRSRSPVRASPGPCDRRRPVCARSGDETGDQGKLRKAFLRVPRPYGLCEGRQSCGRRETRQQHCFTRPQHPASARFCVCSALGIEGAPVRDCLVPGSMSARVGRAGPGRGARISAPRLPMDG